METTTHWAKMTTHWSEQYRSAPSSTLEGKIYLAACYCLSSIGDEARARAVGQYAFDHNCSIWHAAWELGPKIYPCACSPCRNAENARINL
jgi:hypothetical protein